MIEATIIGRPVLTVEVPEFAATQAGTTHFHYLTPSGGGPVASASDFDQHLSQLSRALASPEAGRAARERFVRAFVRPRGLDQPAVDFVVGALEALPRVPRRPQRDASPWLAPLRWLLRRGFGAAPETAG
jgi:hypothetical protein